MRLKCEKCGNRNGSSCYRFPELLIKDNTDWTKKCDVAIPETQKPYTREIPLAYSAMRTFKEVPVIEPTIDELFEQALEKIWKTKGGGDWYWRHTHNAYKVAAAPSSRY